MNMPTPEHQSYIPASAGAQLRAYRENAQMTVDDVAHQLKLARRQVLAIENDEFDALPGPTFVRGFIRNYARLLRIDAQPLLEASNLAVPASAPIERIGPTIGELPADHGSSSTWTRWLIPAGLVLVLAAGIAFYEFSDMTNGAKKARKDSPPADALIAPPATSAPDTAAIAPADKGAGSAPAAPATAPPTGQAAVAGQNAPGTAVAPPPAAAPNAANVAPAAAAQGAQPQPAAGSGRVDLVFSGPSWVEIRDGHGELVLSRTLPGTVPQSYTGVLPLTLRIGHASAVKLAFNGTPIDLAPHTQREIARLTLPLPRP